MLNRRRFIKKGGLAGSLLFMGAFPFRSLAKDTPIRLTILHTNDTQGQLEPFPEEAPKFAGLGGVQARADMIRKIRIEETNVLLFDAGDFFQGSPSFDLYKGTPQIRAMELMGYNAVCIGEHEFDGGIDNLAEQASRASFPFICSNYDLQRSALAGKILPYTIIEHAGIKIGVLGLSADLKNKITEDAARSIGYYDPVAKANETAGYLRKKQNCDFIVCLSHLGLNDKNQVNDKIVAKESRNIDLIIGGHTHSLLQKPLRYFNLDKAEVLIVQAGWGGVHLGRIDYLFSSQKNILSTNAQTVEIGK